MCNSPFSWLQGASGCVIIRVANTQRGAVMEKTKMSRKFWLSLVIFSLVGQVAWVVENMYLNVFIYKMFHASADAISLMVAASAVSATVMVPFPVLFTVMS